MTRSWKVGDVVRLYDGPFGTGTIFKVHEGGEACDVARPYAYATETGGWYVGVEVVKIVQMKYLTPAEVDPNGNPRRMMAGCYTYEDLKRVASGEWKL